MPYTKNNIKWIKELNGRMAENIHIYQDEKEFLQLTNKKNYNLLKNRQETSIDTSPKKINK